MKVFFVALVLLQAILMMVDEFYYHWKRNLPVWERRGHPVDTFFFLLALGVLSFAPPFPEWQMTYLGFGVLSSLVITKDEWVHKSLVSGGEQWIHSMLFLVHPAVLMSAYFIWPDSAGLIRWVFFGVLGFWIYQLLFWNIYADRLFAKRFRNCQ